MNEQLRYYIALNGELLVMQGRSGSMDTLGTHFKGQTVEDLTGCRDLPEVVFAAVAFDGGYRTQDGGKSWEKILDGDVRTFTVHPYDERVIYAGMGPVGLLRSHDRGGHWEPLEGLLRMPQQVRAQWTVPEAYQGIQHPHVRHIFIHPDDTNRLVVLLEHGGVVISHDSGKTWEDGSQGISYLDMHMVRNYPGSMDRFYVSSARGFFRSDDGGHQWRRVENGMPWAYTELYSYSHEWLFLPGDTPRMILGGGKGSPGVWRREARNPQGTVLLSDDAGENWRITSAGIPAAMPWMPWVFLSHPYDSKSVFVGMGDGARGFGFNPRVRGHGALYVTRDRGDSWEPVLGEMPSVLTAWIAVE